MKKSYLILIFVLGSTMAFAQITSVSPNNALPGQTLTLIVSGNNLNWQAIVNSPTISYPSFSIYEDGIAGSMNQVFGIINQAASTSTQGIIDITIPTFQPTGPYHIGYDNALVIQTLPNSFYIGSVTSINEQATQKELLIVTDLLGRKTKTPTKNEPFLHIYNDGTVEKRIVIE